MKTTLNHLKDLRPDHAVKAIANLRAGDADEEIASMEYCELRTALFNAFDWDYSPEGEAFWSDIYDQLIDGTYFDAPQLTPETCEAEAKEFMHGLPDTGGRSEFSTGAVRDASEGKGVPSHLPTRALMRASRRFEDGAAKYDAHNWRKGIPLSRYIDSMNRHTWLFMQGDTSEDHLGAITWNALCLSETFDLISEGMLPQSLNDLPEHNINNK
jgi:hypothetical protein